MSKIIVSVVKGLLKENPTISQTTNKDNVVLVQYIVCNSNKNRFINKKQARRLLSRLELKTL